MARDCCGRADYINVNAGIFVGQEPEYLTWLVETVQQATEKPFAIDSPDPSVIESALAVHRGTPMINSISIGKGSSCAKEVWSIKGVLSG